MKKRMNTLTFRLSDADRQTLKTAARMTGRCMGEYVRELAVLCAIQQVILRGGEKRLPAEHRRLLGRQDEEVTVGDVVGRDNQLSLGV